MNFTLIAYKPDSSCVCMGNVTDNYGSDFHMSHHETLRSLMEKRAEYDEYECGDQELCYELTLLVDGRPMTECGPGIVNQCLELERTIRTERAEAKEAARVEAERLAAEEVQRKLEEETTAQATSDKQTLLSLAEKLNFTVTPK